MTDNEKRLKPIERRTFLRYSLIGATSAGLGGFALSSLGFLWPRRGDQLFGEVPFGDAASLAAEISDTRTPLRAEGGISIIVWDPQTPGAEFAYGEDHQAVVDDTTALMALYTQACPHLGCAVPWCQTSQWFECPCHGSRYNRYGEWTDGPAPRGLDRFPSYIDGDGQFVVDVGNLLTGPARTANVLEQPPEGPNCVDV
ncbi:MAG: ubiquinol-cytochrome c reductase iron-sulfur subunit [Nitriliruptoraceae bacterium]